MTNWLDSSTQGVEGSPEDIAGYWFARLQSPKATAGDWQRFEDWRAQSPANTAAYEALESFWLVSGQAKEAPEIAAFHDSERIHLTARRSYLSLAVAASVLAVIMGGCLWLSETGNLATMLSPGQWLTTDRGQRTFSTAIGERSTVKLHDGSVITLDTNSEVEIAFAATERKIRLKRGQVMFEVAHDSSRPFTVQAGDRRVIATGTIFTVRLDDAAVSVALMEGNVTVEQLPAERGAPKAKTALQPGERLIAKAGSAASVTTADMEQVTSWRSGKVVFLDTPIADAAKELNRYSGDKIVLVGEALAEMRINGVFRTGQPLDFARAVAAVYPVAIDQQRPGQIRIVAADSR